MINFFNALVNRNKGTVAVPTWSYVQNEINVLTDTVIKYYRNAAYAVPSNHELVKILHGLALSTDTDLATYARKVDNASMNLAQQLGYTTESYHGRIFSNVFMGKGSREVLIAANGNFNAREATEDWMNVRAVRILRHGFDQLDFFPFDGTVISNRVNVFAINIPLLAVQYRAYRQHQKVLVAGTGETGQNSIYHFLYSYVLNNMQYDSISMALFNRMMKVAAGKKTNDQRFRHPFHITDLNSKVDAVMDVFVKAIRNGNMDIAQILINSPMPSWTNGLDFMSLPDVIATRQINWALYLSRIHVLSFLTEVDLDTLLRTNRTELNRVKYMLSVYLNDNSIRSAVPIDMYEREKATIESIIKKL